MNARLALPALAAVTLTAIFDHELWTPDEPRDAEIAREMADGGSWAVPTLNRKPHLEKPPMFFWSAAAAFKILGAHAWVGRIPSVLFSWGTLLFTFLLARRMFGRETAWRAALLLATTWGYAKITHKCTVDNALVFCTTGTLYWLHRAFSAERKLPSYLLAYLFALGAILSKGLIGPGLAAGAFGLFLLWNRSGREILRTQPWFGVAIVLGGAAAWFATLSPEHRDVVLLHNNLGRFTGQGYEGGHRNPFYYYGIAYWYELAPWGCLLPPAIPWLRRPEDGPAKRLLISWLAVGLVGLSIAATKREIYLLPLAPAVAILVAAWFERGPSWRRSVFRILAIAIALGLLAAPAGAIYYRNWIGLGVALAMMGAAACFAWNRSWERAIPMGMAALFVSAAHVAVPEIDKAKTLRPFCRSLPAMDSVPAYKPDETTIAVVNFYSGIPVRPVESEEEAVRLAANRPAFLLIVRKRDRDWTELRTGYPYDWVVQETPQSRKMALISNVPR